MKKLCPCDIDGICPFDANYIQDCEYWCHDEAEDDYKEYDEND